MEDLKKEVAELKKRLSVMEELLIQAGITAFLPKPKE